MKFKAFTRLLKPAPQFVLFQNNHGTHAGCSYLNWSGYVPPGTVAVWKVRLKKG